MGSVSESGRSPGGGHDNPLQYSCLENPMDTGAWQATAHRVAKSWTKLCNFVCRHTHINIHFSGDLVVNNSPAEQETWVQLPGREDLLEKGMATHSSILVWRIPWTEELGRLQSIRPRRVRHN